MRFMMLMIPEGAADGAPETPGDPASTARMLRYTESLQRAGVLLALDQLHPPSMGARVSFSDGKAQIRGGDVRAAHEVVGGYWLIQVKSREEAIAWATRCPVGEHATIEIRQVRDTSDVTAPR